MEYNKNKFIFSGMIKYKESKDYEEYYNKRKKEDWPEFSNYKPSNCNFIGDFKGG